MFEFIKNFFRERALRSKQSDIPTGFIPLEDISVASVIIDVEEGGFDEIKNQIVLWSKDTGIKVNIYYFDFRKLGKEELLLTSISNTILRRELNWFGMPDLNKISPIINDDSDLFISLIANGNFPIDFLARCSRARFKVGRYEYDGHPYNMIFYANTDGENLVTNAKNIFINITDFLSKVK